MFQWDNALIYLGVTILAAAGVQPNIGIPMVYLYAFVAVFGSALAVGIRWWRGHLTTKVARVIAFIAGVFGSGIVSPRLMSMFGLEGTDAFIVIGLASMISARIIIFYVAKLNVEKLGEAAQDRLVKVINPRDKDSNNG